MKINCHCHIFSLDCVLLEFRKRFVLDVKNSQAPENNPSK